jgi:hypothetical protein
VAGKGKNRLGKLLEELRQELKLNQDSAEPRQSPLKRHREDELKAEEEERPLKRQAIVL